MAPSAGSPSSESLTTCSPTVISMHEDDQHMDEKATTPKWLEKMQRRHEQISQSRRQGRSHSTFTMFVTSKRSCWTMSLMTICVGMMVAIFVLYRGYERMMTRSQVGTHSIAPPEWREYAIARWWSSFFPSRSNLEKQLDMEKNFGSGAEGIMASQVVGGPDFDESDADANANGEQRAGHNQADAEETDARGCSLLDRRLVANVTSWTVRETGKFSYLVHLVDSVSVPSACASDALFSVRLVHGQAPSSSDVDSYQILYSSPHLTPESIGYHSPGYAFNLTHAHSILPNAEYEIQVEMDFGSLPGAKLGQVCPDKQCRDLERLSDSVGHETAFIGVRVGFEHIGTDKVWLGNREQLDTTEGLPLCDDFDKVDGYWTGLRFNLIDKQGQPCQLVTRQDPFAGRSNLLMDRAKQQPKPLWLHFVGDSNTRNAFMSFVQALGPGPYGSNVVYDSPVKNGSVATLALRSFNRNARVDHDDHNVLPQIILSWSWWYQAANEYESTTTVEPTNEDSSDTIDSATWSRTIFNNLAELNRLTLNNMTLESYCHEQGLDVMLDGDSRTGPTKLRLSAGRIEPDFVYVSMGSHAPELTVEGQTSSFELLSNVFKTRANSEDEGHERFWRIMTTTHVEPSHIPIDRWPHQDLVRNNQVIEAKNEALRQSVTRLAHDDSGHDNQRIELIDVGSLTRTMTFNHGAEGMKQSKKTGRIDALHFRQRVYNEWSRMVWTDVVTTLSSQSPSLE
ncbi:hypothetical protein OIO90_006101 [Microbotryomycetes sp. JL221]|nr:hypothetical protein OIO90_006101 [Microbotryomycetes sp. JL221]